VRIEGAYFTGATAVDVGATVLTAAEFTVVNDGLIVISAPAESAGTSAVTVTTAAGTGGGASLTYA